MNRSLSILISVVFAAAICYADQTVDQKKIPGPVTSVKMHLGKPAFFLNDKPYTKPIFETYAPLTKYFKDFADAGCDVYSFSTNIGNGFGPPCWVAPDKWDFSELDARAHRVLEADPNALIMPRILVWAPEWWKQQNPGELLVLDDGTNEFNKQIHESVGSEKWRKDMSDALRIMVEHMQNSDYKDHMFGYMVEGMATEEWYHFALNAEPLADYSKANTLAFQKWLKNKYGTVEKLRASWSDPNITFESVAIPSKKQRIGDRAKTFRDAKTEMNVIDFYLFNSDIIPETIDLLAKVVKDVTAGTKVVGAFYGFMFEFSGDPEFGHNALAKYLKSTNLDYMMVTASYGNRFVGTGSDYCRSPATTVALHGKLWYHDNDTISYLYPQVMQSVGYTPEKAEFEGSRLGGTKTARESLWLYQRSAGFVLGWGFFESFFDLHGGYYHDPNLVNGFKQLYKVFDESKNFPQTSVSQILVISDETSNAYGGFRSPLISNTVYHPQSTFTKIGAPHDSILIDDIPLVNLDQYKLFIFLNNFNMTDDQRALVEKVKQKGKTVLWCYAEGLFNGNQMSLDAMKKTTGMNITTDKVYRNETPRIKLVNSEHPLAKALTGAGLSEFGPGVVYKQHTGAFEQKPKGGNVDAPKFTCQLFYVDDPQATVLGTLPNAKEATLAIKQSNGSSLIYTVASNMPASFYREIARFAGVHIYHDADETLYAGKSYLTLCAERAGNKTVKLPGRFDVIDPFTDKTLFRNVSEFQKDMQKNETLIVRLQQAK